MSSVATIEPIASTPYWVEEGRAPGGRSRFLAKISGLHCSLCTGTIEKALGRLPGVHKVAVSLTQVRQGGYDGRPKHPGIAPNWDLEKR